LCSYFSKVIPRIVAKSKPAQFGKASSKMLHSVKKHPKNQSPNKLSKFGASKVTISYL